MGRFLVSAMPVAVLLVMLASEGKAIATHRTADQLMANNARANVEQLLLEKVPGYHVILVRYTGGQSVHEEWVYNLANIDAAPVIWARDLGQVENERLRHYYAGRSFWLFKPDESMSLRPY